MRGSVRIRREEKQDWAGVQTVHEAAFARSAEANLVAALRERAHPLVSLVAEQEGTVVGHILFSPVVLPNRPELKIMGLAPVAVVPKHQCKGIGSALIRTGLDQCAKLGRGAVVVLGHPEYYRRFGFSPSTYFDIGCEYAVPREAFMIVELQPGFLFGASGTIRYDAACDNV
jgi:putative acetyltransferase